MTPITPVIWPLTQNNRYQYKCRVWTTAMIAVSWLLLVMAVYNTAKSRIIDGRLRRYRKIPGDQTRPRSCLVT
jgi:hypothetical protein